MKRIAFCTALVALAGPACAQSTTACAPRDTVLERLASRYGETRRSIGLGAGNQLVEVFASAESGSWTITVTTAAGLTCLVASGLAFETMADKLSNPDKGA